MYSISLHRNACVLGKGLVNSSKLHRPTVKFRENDRNIFNLSLHCFSTGRTGAQNISVKILDKVRAQFGSLRGASKRYLHVNEVNTNVQNNVILYKCEKKGQVMGIVITGIVSAFTCAVGSYYTYTPQFFTSWKNFDTVTDYVKEYGLRFSLCGFMLIQLPLLSSLIYLLLARNIKYIILLKGGKNVSITTYNVLKNYRSFTCPVSDVSTSVSRNDKGYVPLKIKHKSMFYVLDGNGIFPNEELYDHTVGTRKNWAKHRI